MKISYSFDIYKAYKRKEIQKHFTQTLNILFYSFTPDLPYSAADRNNKEHWYGFGFRAN